MAAGCELEMISVSRLSKALRSSHPTCSMDMSRSSVDNDGFGSKSSDVNVLCFKEVPVLTVKVLQKGATQDDLGLKNKSRLLANPFNISCQGYLGIGVKDDLNARLRQDLVNAPASKLGGDLGVVEVVGGGGRVKVVIDEGRLTRAVGENERVALLSGLVDQFWFLWN